MIVTIHQPDYLPWLGFFDRWRKSDLFIVLDDVQFLRRGWHHRDQIKTSEGVAWLTVPVVKKGRYLQRIKDVEIDTTENWVRKHAGLIHSAYAKAPNFNTVFEEYMRMLSAGHTLLSDLNMELLKYCERKLQIRTPVLFSSELKVAGKSTERLVRLVKSVGGKAYLTGTGARNYLDPALFEREGIAVNWQEYTHPVYPQLHGPFVKMLSVLDFFMMVPDPGAFINPSTQ